MNFFNYVEKVKELGLSKGTYAILGSGPLAIRKIRDSKDIDIITTKEVYKEFKKKKGWKTRFAYGHFFLRNGNMEIWKRIGSGKTDIKGLIERAEIIEGLPFVNLNDFIDYKKNFGRKKDFRDIKLAQKWIKENR